MRLCRTKLCGAAELLGRARLRMRTILWQISPLPSS